MAVTDRRRAPAPDPRPAWAQFLSHIIVTLFGALLVVVGALGALVFQPEGVAQETWLGFIVTGAGLGFVGPQLPGPWRPPEPARRRRARPALPDQRGFGHVGMLASLVITLSIGAAFAACLTREARSDHDGDQVAADPCALSDLVSDGFAIASEATGGTTGSLAAAVMDATQRVVRCLLRHAGVDQTPHIRIDLEPLGPDPEQPDVEQLEPDPMPTGRPAERW